MRVASFFSRGSPLRMSLRLLVAAAATAAAAAAAIAATASRAASASASRLAQAAYSAFKDAVERALTSEADVVIDAMVSRSNLAREWALLWLQGTADARDAAAAPAAAAAIAVGLDFDAEIDLLVSRNVD